MSDHFALPDEVRANVIHVFGDGGRNWLGQLPGVTCELLARWHLTPSGRAFAGGSHALVLPFTCVDGAHAVLKIPVLDDENRLEAAALRCYGGAGAVHLYGADPGSGALLLERAEPGTPLANHPQRDAAVDIMCGLLRRLRRAVGGAHDFPLVRDLVSRWSEHWPALHDRRVDTFSDELASEALVLARELATPDADEVLVNRDPHLGNVLAAEREPWLLIDPKPLVGEPAFDGGYLLLDLLGSQASLDAATSVSDRVAEGLRVDAARVRAWALARAIENAMWLLDGGDDPSHDIAMAALLAALR